jgi:RND family efflux transporter MFP subunit
MKKNLIRIFFGLATSALVVGCHRSGDAQHGGMQMPPPVVATTSVQQQEIVEWDEFTGRTAAIENVEVRPRVSGHIEAVKFQSGQLVKKGDVLFQIDARWHRADLDRREADYAQAKVKLANAEREAKRTTQLLANRAISAEEADQREARFQEAKAALQAVQAARDSAKLDLDFTTIRSPIDGRVSRALITEGNYVNGASGISTVLTTIVSVDPVYVYADVDENALLKFNALLRAKKISSNGDGQVPVELELADETGFPHRGHIESFDNKVDPAAGSILLRAVFPNPDARLVPGLFARIRLPGSERKPAVLVDESVIGTDQARKFVLTIASQNGTNTAQYRPVTLGPVVQGKRIVREGLQPGEQVVRDVVMARVRPGMQVQLQPEGGATNSVVGQTAQR